MAGSFWDSPRPWFIGAAVLAVVAVASMIEIEEPALPEGTVEDVAKLRERDDLNVVFLLVDTLRADHLGTYGYGRRTSENIDLMAAGGIVFDKVYSQSSWTKTSMASLWTATRPINSGILHYDHVLPDEATLPAEIFRAAGYRTAGIWRNGWIAPNFGFDQGFQTYVKPTIGRERVRMARKNPSPNRLMGTDEDSLNSANAFLEAFGTERFFLYLHLMDLHQYVYDESATKFGTRYIDAYDQSIHWTDRVFAALLQSLADHDLLRKTVIVIGSDHGEAFQEHGWEGHARNLYSEVTWVPFIIIPPFRLAEPIRVPAVASNMDLWPTVLDLVGLPPIPGADGVSLVPLILEAGGAADHPPTEGLHRTAYSQINRGWGKKGVVPNPLVGVTDGNLRMLVPVNQPEESEFYDRESDAEERRNLLGTRPEDAAAMRALADAYMAEAESPWGREPDRVELSEMQRGQLHALGYVLE